MKIETFSYSTNKGWSVTPFPAFDSKQTLVLVFCAPEFIDNPQPILDLAKAYPGSTLVGCSTAGEIFGTQVQDHSLAVAVVQFQDTRIEKSSASVHKSAESFDAGKSIGERLKQPDLRAVFVLSDGNNVNGSELVRGINSALPQEVVVTGGLAGDGDRFKRTWVINEGKPVTDTVVAVGLYGQQVEIGFGSHGGWDIFGLERTVTRSEGNVLYELDGKPALQLYKEYLGDLAKGLPSSALLFPLALRANSADTQSIVRTVLAVDEATQSMTFAGDIPQGYRAQLMKANFDRLIEGAAQAATKTQAVKTNGSKTDNGDSLSIAVSCVGRRLVLGERSEEELEAALEKLPNKTRQLGFYSYGEISPSGGYCDLHNQTMTITTISEGKGAPASEAKAEVATEIKPETKVEVKAEAKA